MINTSDKQTLYIRKLNGLGQKISVQSNIKVKELKQIVHSLQSLQTKEIKQKDFNLVFKGKIITTKPQSTLQELNIPSDGIIHLVFHSEQQSQNLINANLNVLNFIQQDPIINININKPSEINLRVIFNGKQHQFIVNPELSVLDFKKQIAIKLNLIYESLILSHLGIQMMNQNFLKDYYLDNETLISLKFNLQKPQKKKLESRMVSSVTFSDENNEPNTNNIGMSQFANHNKLVTSSNSIDSQKEDLKVNNSSVKKLTSLFDNNKTTMYKSDINSFSSNSQGASKAALMFTNALHQKILQTESVVSGSFSQDTSMTGSDPNSIMVTVKNQEQTKQIIFQCSKTHQMLDLKTKLLQIQKVFVPQLLQISLEEDLFQSIDLNKSGCLTLNEIVKKMGKERAVFVYRIIKNQC